MKEVLWGLGLVLIIAVMFTSLFQAITGYTVDDWQWWVVCVPICGAIGWVGATTFT